MNILMLNWDSFAHEYVIEAFAGFDCKTDIFIWPFAEENMRENKSLELSLTKSIKEKEYDFVFSLNFFRSQRKYAMTVV